MYTYSNWALPLNVAIVREKNQKRKKKTRKDKD